MKRTWIGVIGSLLVCLGNTAHGATCEQAINAAQAEKSLKVDNNGTNVLRLSDSNLTEVQVSCAPSRPDVTVTWKAQSPGAVYFAMVGRLGAAASGTSASKISQAARTCLSQSVANGGDITQLEKAAYGVECQVDSEADIAWVTVYAPQ